MIAIAVMTREDSRIHTATFFSQEAEACAGGRGCQRQRPRRPSAQPSSADCGYSDDVDQRMGCAYASRAAIL